MIFAPPMMDFLWHPWILLVEFMEKPSRNGGNCPMAYETSMWVHLKIGYPQFLWIFIILTYFDGLPEKWKVYLTHIEVLGNVLIYWDILADIYIYIYTYISMYDAIQLTNWEIP